MNKISLKEKLKKTSAAASVMKSFYLMSVKEYFRAVYRMTGDKRYLPESWPEIMGYSLDELQDESLCGFVERIASSCDQKKYMHLEELLIRPFAKIYEKEGKEKWKDNSPIL